MQRVVKIQVNIMQNKVLVIHRREFIRNMIVGDGAGLLASRSIAATADMGSGRDRWPNVLFIALDEYECKNLAGNPEYAETKAKLGKRLPQKNVPLDPRTIEDKPRK